MPEDRLAAFLGLDFGPAGDPKVAVARAILLAAIYRTHCLCRFGHIRRGPAAVEAMQQACREVVRGHRGAAAVYDAAQLGMHGNLRDIDFLGLGAR